MTSRHVVRVCFCLKRARPSSEFRINFNTTWDLSTEHWWDLITFENPIYFYNIVLIVCLCQKIPSLPLQMENLARCLKVVFFPVPKEVVCSFSNILFDIFWPKFKFGLHIRIWGRGFGCLRLSFYLSKRVSLCSK